MSASAIRALMSGYGGILLCALVAILWLWFLVNPQPEPAASALPFVKEPDWTPQNDKQRALLALKRARDNGRIALHNRSQVQANRAIHEIQAALVSVKKHYGVAGPLTLTGEASFNDFLAGYVAYIDSFYPYLREGHLQEANERAGAFTWKC